MKKSYLILLLLVVVMLVFGGCGGGGGGGSGNLPDGNVGNYYPFDILDGTWEMITVSGSATGVDGRYTITLNQSSPVNGAILEYLDENAEDTLAHFVAQSYSEYRARRTDGYTALVILDNSIATGISVVRLSNDTFRYKMLNTSTTIIVRCINDNTGEATEDGTFYVDGYPYKYSIKYTIVRR